MLCCGTKRPRQQPMTGKRPKAQIVFNVDDYNPKAFTSQEDFIRTEHKIVIKEEPAVMIREEDYAQQLNEVKKSKLLGKLDLLNYDLDVKEGISQTPMINTFHYETLLSHGIIPQKVRNYNEDKW